MQKSNWGFRNRCFGHQTTLRSNRGDYRNYVYMQPIKTWVIENLLYNQNENCQANLNQEVVNLPAYELIQLSMFSLQFILLRLYVSWLIGRRSLQGGTTSIAAPFHLHIAHGGNLHKICYITSVKDIRCINQQQTTTCFSSLLQSSDDSRDSWPHGLYYHMDCIEGAEELLWAGDEHLEWLRHQSHQLCCLFWRPDFFLEWRIIQLTKRILLFSSLCRTKWRRCSQQFHKPRFIHLPIQSCPRWSWPFTMKLQLFTSMSKTFTASVQSVNKMQPDSC